jgi:hypothetical protein
MVRSGLPYKSTKPAHEVDTFELPHTTTTALMPPPASTASSPEKIEFLHQQLDSMGMDAEILPGLILLGSGNKERLQGGALCYPSDLNRLPSDSNRAGCS